MQDFMKLYNDMSAFYVTIDQSMVTELVENICNSMNYTISIECEDFTLFRHHDDKRSFLLAVKSTQPFYGISIKCKSIERKKFFEIIAPQLSKMDELWGMPHVAYDEYPDWLSCDYKVKNPVEDDLQSCGLL